MSIIDFMPAALERCGDDVPYPIQVGYAMWAVRSVLGGHVVRTPAEITRDADGHIRVMRWVQRDYRSVEDAALANLILEHTPPPPIELTERRIETNDDLPRIRANFLQKVDSVLKLLNSDGTYRVRNKHGELEWTGSVRKIADELNVPPSVVRQAQAQLKKGA